jgi:integrase
MQRGTIIEHHGSWTLVYRDTQIRDGQRKRVKVWKKLAPKNKEYPSKRSVRLLADEILGPLNRKQLQPESSMTVAQYIDDVYFPFAEQSLRPSTLDRHKFTFKKCKPRLDIRMRDFRTVHGQRLLREITAGRRTLIHIKAFLSTVFRHAKQEGVLDGLNPMVDVSVPGKPTKFRGASYSIADAYGMLEALEITEEKNLTKTQERLYDTASDVVAVLSMTGLRTSECRALRWADWDEENNRLMIERSAWETTIGPTKNIASEAPIPVIPLLAEVLNRRRKKLEHQKRPHGPQDYIFAGERRGVPLNFANLVNRAIKPALEANRLYKIEKGEWQPDDSTTIHWKGYHGFRRGLASNLLGLGVNPKIIQAILRHSDVSTTLQFYTLVPDEDTRLAMQKLEDTIRTRLLGQNQSGKQ